MQLSGETSCYCFFSWKYVFRGQLLPDFLLFQYFSIATLKLHLERSVYLDKSQREPSCRIASPTTEELQGCGLPELGSALPLTHCLPLSISPGRWSQTGAFMFLPITVQLYSRFFAPPSARGRAGLLLSAALAVGSPSRPALGFGLGAKPRKSQRRADCSKSH